MSGLRQAAGEYLALRRSLGFALATPGRQVQQFAAYLDSIGAAHVTADLAVTLGDPAGWSRALLSLASPERCPRLRRLPARPRSGPSGPVR